MSDRRYVVVLVLISIVPVLYAFPPTTWWETPDTAATAQDWDEYPAYNGNIANTWPNIPLKADAKVLFIGNSITDRGPISDHVERLVNNLHPGMNISCTLMGRGEAWLKDYVAETNLGIMDAIRSGQYDVVVVQPYQDSYYDHFDCELSDFIDAGDAIYQACEQSGAQMVIWSVHGYVSDDRFWYFAFSSLNCRRLAQRLHIPYCFTVETFENIYRETDDEFLWDDIIHESSDAEAVFATLIYSVLMGGESIESWPADWSNLSGNPLTYSSFRHQNVLSTQVGASIERQNAFNFGSTITDCPYHMDKLTNSKCSQTTITTGFRPGAVSLMLLNGRTGAIAGQGAGCFVMPTTIKPAGH